MILTILFIAIVAIIIYQVRKFNKIPEGLENVPHVSGLPTAWAWIRQKPYNEIQDLVYETAAKDNELFLTRLGAFTQLSIVGPDALKIFLMESEEVAIKFDDYPPEDTLFKFFGTGLPFSNGEMWKTYRDLANPIFNEAMSTEDVGDNVFELFNFMNHTLGQPIDVFEVMQRFTIEALGNKIFGYKFGCFKTMETPRLMTLYKFIMSKIESPYYQIFPWISKLPLNSNKQLFSALEEFDGLMYDVLKTKKSEIENNRKRGDLLTIMIESNKNASDKQLRDQLVNYFVAGHETTTMALSNVLYYLAVNPEMQEKARAEAIRIFGNEPVVPTNDQLKEMRYINAVIKEGLRINPPTPIVTFRKLAKPVKIGPYIIPKDTLCSANAWQIHNNPKYWENPRTFRPERFITDDKTHQFAWIPFSAGPRNCVGQNFSILEQRIVMAMALLKYKWTLPEDTINKDELILTSQVLLRPVDLKLIFTERN
jgi:cytochrome P450